ncbi:MAG: hypothetical protein JJU32_10585 [Phormidium sp. BM_Day4_Bin.17]|nr:hypothetical protein [Phormidium sp. BM_Day4_Bin.17]UCJ12070.1 MAG: hypothetical protein JWS08_20590 [Phormidium sp. PBR-2020]
MTTILENPDNLILGDEGDNLLEGTAVGVIDGLEGDDTILSPLNASEPGSTLFGNAGNDYIRSRGVGDFAFGGPGNDTLVNENGQGLMFGDQGSDYLIAQASGATLFGGSDMEDSPDDGDNILISQGGKNILVGGGGNDTLLGFVGGDTMAGRGGDDYIVGGPEGNNFLFGNTGLDSLLSLSIERPDSLYGGQDDDHVAVGSDSTADNPILAGGQGSDSLEVQGSQVDGAILIGDANLEGGFSGSDAGDDYLYVAGGNNHQLFGNAGGDTLAIGINVGIGVSLFGGVGNDFLVGTGGAGLPLPAQIKAFGDKGSDTLMLAGSDSEFWGDNPTMKSDFGNNTIIGIGVGNTLRGGNDFTTGSNAGSNTITAELGDIELAEGEESKNVLMGGPGDDTLDASNSGPGDTLIGGPEGAGGNNTFMFTANQYIQADLSGASVNTYIGVNAGNSDIAVTVGAQDVVQGDGNFFFTGEQSRSISLKTGGMVIESNRANFIQITDDASGVTKTGSGDDFFDLGNVSGSVDAGDGDNTINVGSTVSGNVTAGDGNNTVNLSGSDCVSETGVMTFGGGENEFNISGSVFGRIQAGKAGQGKNTLTALTLGQGGIFDFSQSESSSINVTNVFGGGQILVGGISSSVNVSLAYSGASFTALSGDNRIILDALTPMLDEEGNPEAEQEAISITGGDGNDFLGVSSSFSFSSSISMSLNISVTGGNNVMQGAGFGDRIIAGIGNDVIYGGSVSFQETSNTYNGFQIQGATASRIALDFSSISNGDFIDLSKGGNNRVLFRSRSETGFSLQRSFRSFQSDKFLSLGSSGTSDINVGTGLSSGNLLVGSNGQFIGANGTSTTGVSGTSFTKGVFSGAVGIDTLNNFQVGRDKIVLDSSEFTVTSESVTLFRSRGALYGVIADGAGDVNGGTTYGDFDNVLNNDGYFHEAFAIGATSAADLTAVDFSQEGHLFFDMEAQGLYLGVQGGAKLIARLPGVNLTGEVGGTVANDFVTTQGIGDDQVALF